MVENLFFFHFSMDVDFVIGSSEMHFRWQIILNIIAEFGHRDLVVDKWKGETVSYCWFKESFKYVFPVNISSNSYMYEYFFIICSCNRKYLAPICNYFLCVKHSGNGKCKNKFIK